MKTATGCVYLSGPMTGMPELNYPAFNEAARLLRAQGRTVFNPAEIAAGEDWHWIDYMRACIIGLMGCTEIHLLHGWENSKGARLELYNAMALGFVVVRP